MKKQIFTDKAAAAIGPYSQAIQWGDVVFISGQIPLIPSSGELNNETFSDQASQVIDNLEAICIEKGGGLDNILKLNVTSASGKLVGSSVQNHNSANESDSDIVIKGEGEGNITGVDQFDLPLKISDNYIFTNNFIRLYVCDCYRT